MHRHSNAGRDNVDLRDLFRSLAPPPIDVTPTALAPRVVEPDLADRVIRVLAAWAQGLGEQTRARYRRDAQAFLTFVESVRGPFPEGLIAATPSDCAAFVNAVATHGRSTRGVRAAVLRSMYRALVVEGLVQHNPAADVRPANASTGEHYRKVPKELVEAVLDELRDSNDIRHVRDRALLLVTLDLGTRRSEVAGLRVGDIERDDTGVLLNVHGKGSKDVRMPLRPAAIKAVDRWLNLAGHAGDPEAHIFTNLSVFEKQRASKSLTPAGVYRIVKSYFKKYSPHGLRARAITDTWARSDRNIHIAQIFARHSSPTVTEQCYIQAEKLEEAMQFAPDYT